MRLVSPDLPRVEVIIGGTVFVNAQDTLFQFLVRQLLLRGESFPAACQTLLQTGIYEM